MKLASIKIIKILLALGALLLFLYLPCASAQNEEAGERILSFVSEIHINPDASAEVTETIQVVAQQNQIRHGIYRLLLSHFRDDNGAWHSLKYDIQDVLLDSQKAPFHLNNEDEGEAIYVGSANQLLPPGTYTYTLKYHAYNVVTFLPKEDEFYWNITGNKWNFPILAVHATIYLPQNAAITHYTAYTGRSDTPSKYFQASAQANQASFSTTRVLVPGEGLTVALAWPKGIIHQADSERLKQNITNYLRHNLNTIYEVLIGLLLFYYILAWYLVARDPPKGVIIPLFEPPPGLSPVGMRFISKMGMDYKSFSTAIINLATAGLLSIQEDEDGSYTLSKQDGDTSKVSSTEKNLFTRLFLLEDIVDLSSKQADLMDSCKNKLSADLKNEFSKKYFLSKHIYSIPGFLALLAAIVIGLCASDLSAAESPIYLFVGLFFIAFIHGQFVKTHDLLCGIKARFSFSNFISTLAALILLLFMLIFGFLLVLGNITPSLVSALLLLSFFPINFIFFHFLEVYTAEGRQLMNKIEGFKMYLATTEQDRLDRLNPPEKTPALFEKYLPFAIALDVENAWGEQFTQVLQKASIGNTSYHPSWYSGGSWSNNNPGGFSNYLSAGLTSSIMSSSIPASSGGGFSGGGGGGGGGGGW